MEHLAAVFARIGLKITASPRGEGKAAVKLRLGGRSYTAIVAAFHGGAEIDYWGKIALAERIFSEAATTLQIRSETEYMRDYREDREIGDEALRAEYRTAVAEAGKIVALLGASKDAVFSAL